MALGQNQGSCFPIFPVRLLSFLAAGLSLIMNVQSYDGLNTSNHSKYRRIYQQSYLETLRSGVKFKRLILVLHRSGRELTT